MTALQDIFDGGFPADKVLQRQLKINKKFGSADRRLVAEAVYDIVRWWRKLLFVCDVEWPETDEWRGLDPKISVAVIEAWAGLNEIEFGKNVPRGRHVNTRAQWNDPALPRAVRESIPDWLDTWGAAQLGARWDEALSALNTIAPVYLRANRLKTTPQNLLQALAKEDIAADLVDGDALKLRQRKNVFLTKAFQAGLFEVQDLSSQQAAPALAPEPGERVIDACAGAGGKSLHLAALMKNKGKIIAMDVAEKKLAQLGERAARAGASVIETRLIESTKVIKRQAETADRLLLDVPCTGLGVLRRNPDSKWRLKASDVTRVRGLQTEILESYTNMLKPGGTLVYATCSMCPAENEDQVQAFLSRNETRFELLEQTTYLPSRDGRDGFFVARLARRS